MKHLFWFLWLYFSFICWYAWALFYENQYRHIFFKSDHMTFYQELYYIIYIALYNLSRYCTIDAMCIFGFLWYFEKLVFCMSEVLINNLRGTLFWVKYTVEGLAMHTRGTIKYVLKLLFQNFFLHNFLAPLFINWKSNVLNLKQKDKDFCSMKVSKYFNFHMKVPAGYPF